jgi:hypothetical protein
MILAASEIDARCDDLVSGGVAFREEFTTQSHRSVIT